MLLIPNTAFRFLGYTTVGVVSAGTLQLLAIVFYLILYRLYIPANAHRSIDVHFDYNLRETYPGAEGLTCTPGTFSQNCAFGGALAVMELNQPKSAPELQEEFSVNLQIEFPKNTQNREIEGNVMLYVLFTSNMADTRQLPSQTKLLKRHQEKQETLSIRSLYLPFLPDNLELLDSILFSPLYILGWKSKSIILNTELTPLPSNKYQMSIVEIDKTVTISSAKMIWTPKWSGLRYLMWHYKITSFLVGVTAFWIIESIVAAIVAATIAIAFQNSSAEYQDKPRTSKQSLAHHKESEPGIPHKNERRKEKSTHKLNNELDDPLKLLGPDPVDSYKMPPDLTPEPSPLPYIVEEIGAFDSENEGDALMDTAATGSTPPTTLQSSNEKQDSE